MPLGIATVALAYPCLFAEVGDRPKDVLLASLERKTRNPYTAVQTQRYLFGNDTPVQVKLEADAAGRLRRTVLQPLRMQGIISMDDGKTWMTFLPDEKRLVVQPSPALDRQSPRKRVRLIESNYTLSFEKPTSRDGRKVLTVVAKAKNPEIPSRRYEIDSESNVILRLVRYSGDGPPRTLIETNAITFNRPKSSDIMAIPQVEGLKTVQVKGPVPLPPAEQAKQQLGFEPAMPQNLPYGFRIVQAQMISSERTPLLALRLSDGLIQATVYQVKPKGSPGSQELRRFRDGIAWNGALLHVSGDLPKAVRLKLIEAFLLTGERDVRQSGTQIEEVGVVAIRKQRTRSCAP